MKTAVSIPDALFDHAEQLADRLGFNRSELYAKALASYIAAHGDDPVTAKLDEIAGATDTALGRGPDVSARDLIDAGAWEW